MNASTTKVMAPFNNVQEISMCISYQCFSIRSPKRKETPTGKSVMYQVRTCKRACPQAPNALDRFTPNMES